MIRLLAVTALATLIAAPALAQELNIYSARHYDTDLALYDRFAEMTGIEVNVVEGGSDELIERLQTEGADSPADLLITVDAGRLWRADEAGLFQPVESELLASRIPAHLRHPDGHWFGLTKRARVIMYNIEAGRPEGLETYLDLADPRFEGELCVRSSTNVYNLSLVAAMIDAHGVERTETWARGLVANMARPPQGGDTTQIEAVAAGLCRLAIANTYYLGRLRGLPDPDMQAVGNAVGVIFPNQEGRGTHVNLSGAGVLAGASNVEKAVQFLEFMVSDEAQAVFALANNEYPVVETVEVTGPIAGFGTFREEEIDPTILGENQPEAVRLTDRAGWR